MFKLNFYDEKPFILIAPKSFDLFKEKVSNNYGFSLEDANEFSYSYFNEEDRKYLRGLSDYMELINFISKNPKNKLKKQTEIFIEISDTSKIFVENIAENKPDDIEIVQVYPEIEKEKIEEKEKEEPIKEEPYKEESKIQEIPEKEKSVKEEKNESVCSFDINKNLDISQSFKIEEYNIINESDKNPQNQKEEPADDIKYPNLNECKEKEIPQELPKEENLAEKKPEEENKEIKENIMEEIITKLLNEKIANLKEEITNTLRKENEERRAQKQEKKNDRLKDRKISSDQNLSYDFEAKQLEKIARIEKNMMAKIENHPERSEKIKEKGKEKIKKINEKIKEKLKEKDKKPSEEKLEPINVNICENSEPKQEKENNEQNENVTIHASVSCDGCKVFPITGIRYKCAVCPDFDFCEKCEEAKWKEHKHPMTKIREHKPRFGMGNRGGCKRYPMFGRKFGGPFSGKCQTVNDNNYNTQENNYCHPFKKMAECFMNKITGGNNETTKDKKEFDKNELKTKKNLIKEILKEKNLSGKEIKSALIVSKLDVDKAILLLIENY